MRIPLANARPELHVHRHVHRHGQPGPAGHHHRPLPPAEPPPGYAGGLLATIGIGVMWGNWVSLATLTVLPEGRRLTGRPILSPQAKAEAGTGTGLAGTSVATETCGQRRPLKFRMTCCEYWICVAVAMIERGAVIATGGFTRNSGTGCPAAPACPGMISGGWPGSKTGTSTVYSTVSTQNVASILVAWAFGWELF